MSTGETEENEELYECYTINGDPALTSTFHAPNLEWDNNFEDTLNAPHTKSKLVAKRSFKVRTDLNNLSLKSASNCTMRA